MAIERRAPDGLTVVNLTGSLAAIQDDPDLGDLNWLVATANNVNTTATVTFPTPTGNPNVGVGLQEFRVLVRKFSATNSGNPTAVIELRENGALLASSAAVSVSSPTGQVLSLAWDASLLTTPNGSGVECSLVSTAAGGGPSARNSVDVGAVEWNVDYTPPSAPGAPTIGTATGGNAQASVAFTPPASNGGSTITSYTATSTPGGFTSTGAASPLVVTGLANGTSYTFKVKATNAIGTGPESAASNAVVPASPTAPGAPTIGTATGGNAQATVAFTPPASNGGSAITSYTATSTPGGLTATGAASPLTVTGLTNGTSYTFKVKATNAIGTGPESAASNSVTPALPAPIRLANDLVGQTDGTTVTTANSANSGTAFNNVFKAADATLAYSATELATGYPSIRVVMPTAGSSGVVWNFGGKWPTLYTRVLFQMAALPSATLTLHQIFTTTDVTSTQGRLAINTAGKLLVYNGNTIVGTSADSIPVGSPVIIESRYVFSTTGTGVAEGRFYPVAAADATSGQLVTVTGLTFGFAYAEQLRIGQPDGTGPAGFEMFLGALAVDDTARIGGMSGPVLPSGFTGWGVPM